MEVNHAGVEGTYKRVVADESGGEMRGCRGIGRESEGAGVQVSRDGLGRGAEDDSDSQGRGCVGKGVEDGRSDARGCADERNTR